MSIVLDAPRTAWQTADYALLPPPQTSLAAIKKAIVLAGEENVAMSLFDVSWATYQATLQAFWGRQTPRFYYEKGNLLIMPTGAKHEDLNRALASLVETICLEWGLEWCNFGSATFQREDVAGGFEPDSCFYFQHEAAMRGRDRLDMATDPPPELIIEIDITSLSTMRQSVYAAFGVAEIWRYDGAQAEILTLENGRYGSVSHSPALPLMTAEKITEFLQLSQTLSRLAWLKQVRDWAKTVCGNPQ